MFKGSLNRFKKPFYVEVWKIGREFLLCLGINVVIQKGGGIGTMKGGPDEYSSDGQTQLETFKRGGYPMGGDCENPSISRIQPFWIVENLWWALIFGISYKNSKSG